MCNQNLILNNGIFYSPNKLNYWEIVDISTFIGKIEILLNRIKNHYSQDNNFVTQIYKCLDNINNKSILSYIERHMKIGNKTDILFNTNTHLVPFINGVYNLEKKEFTTTTPEMYITEWFDIEYNSSVLIDKANDYLKQLKIDKHDIFIKHLSYSLEHTNEGLMLILGSGSNGKTSFIGFLKELFGSNHIKLRNDFFTNQKAEDTTIDKNKMIYTMEIKFANKIDAGILNDRIYGTDELALNGMVVATTNHKPDINSTNDMTDRRVFTYTFGHKFKNNKDTLKRKVIQAKFKTDIELKQSFINLLLDYYYRDIIIEEEQYNDNNPLQDVILDYIKRNFK